MTTPPPYLIVWTGQTTGLEERYIAWTLEAAREVAKTRKARIYKLIVEKEVE